MPKVEATNSLILLDNTIQGGTITIQGNSFGGSSPRLDPPEIPLSTVSASSADPSDPDGILALLYTTEAGIQRAWTRIGIDPTQLPTSGTPVHLWFEARKYMRRRDIPSERLVSIVEADFPKTRWIHLLQLALDSTALE